MNSQGVDILKAIENFQGYLAHVHLNDANESWAGSGGIDFGSIAKALRDIHYKGYLSIEVFNFEPEPKTIAREAITYLRSVFA
jgi:sugar phosphate isomerase/epimerase